MIDEDLLKKWEQKEKEIGDYYDSVLNSLDLNKFKIPDTSGLGDLTLEKWFEDAKRNFNWGMTSNDDVARDAMIIISLIQANFKTKIIDIFTNAIRKTAELNEERMEYMSKLDKINMEVDNMLSIYEEKVKQLEIQLNSIQDKIQNFEEKELIVNDIINDLNNMSIAIDNTVRQLKSLVEQKIEVIIEEKKVIKTEIEEAEELKEMVIEEKQEEVKKQVGRPKGKI